MYIYTYIYMYIIYNVYEDFLIIVRMVISNRHVCCHYNILLHVISPLRIVVFEYLKRTTQYTLIILNAIM